MGELEQRAIDAQIITFYGEEFDEGARLTTWSAQGSLEFTRVQEIVREYLPGGRVLDVGGATGHHSRSLMNSGYGVELIEPVPLHVARDRGGRQQSRRRRAGVAIRGQLLRRCPSSRAALSPRFRQ